MMLEFEGLRLGFIDLQGLVAGSVWFGDGRVFLVVFVGEDVKNRGEDC